MTRIIASTALLAAMGLAGTAATAGTIDFTSDPASTSGTVGGFAYTITTIGGPLTSTTYDGGDPTPVNSFDLAFALDGAGVNDDEISQTMGTSESIIVTFTTPVRATGFAFLDLFKDLNGGDDFEVGVLTVDGLQTVDLSADDVFGAGAGYAERIGLSVIGSQFAFTVRSGNDSAGNPDGALAALQIAAIPVPAAGLLLAGALGGMGLARRRRG